MRQALIQLLRNVDAPVLAAVYVAIIETCFDVAREEAWKVYPFVAHLLERQFAVFGSTILGIACYM